MLKVVGASWYKTRISTYILAGACMLAFGAFFIADMESSTRRVTTGSPPRMTPGSPARVTPDSPPRVTPTLSTPLRQLSVDWNPHWCTRVILELICAGQFTGFLRQFHYLQLQLGMPLELLLGV